MIKRNTAIPNFPLGKLVDKLSGEQITSGATCAIRVDDTSSASENAPSYDGVVKGWFVDLTAEELDGYTVYVALNHVNAIGGGNGWPIKTVAQLMSDFGSGAHPLTITAIDQDDDPVEDALVRVSFGIDSFFARTNSSGQITFSLDTGTYTVSASKPGYTFTPASRTVTGNEAGTLKNSLVMTQNALVAPPEPGLAAVYFFVHKNGVPSPNLKVSAHLTWYGVSASHGTLLTNQVDAVQTNVDGEAVLYLVPAEEFTSGDGNYEITIERVGTMFTRIEGSTTINAEELVE